MLEDIEHSECILKLILEWICNSEYTSSDVKRLKLMVCELYLKAVEKYIETFKKLILYCLSMPLYYFHVCPVLLFFFFFAFLQVSWTFFLQDFNLIYLQCVWIYPSYSFCSCCSVYCYIQEEKKKDSLLCTVITI